MLTKSDPVSKKIGYLVASLVIPPDNDFSVMIVNQLVIDTKSTNILDISYGLIALTKLAREDVIPMLLETCVKLTSHQHKMVRKFALSALLRFHQLNKDSLLDYSKEIIKLLTDSYLGVVSVCLDVVYQLTKLNSIEYKHLVPTLTKLLIFILDGKVEPDYMFHGIPAPWIQIKILRVKTKV